MPLGGVCGLAGAVSELGSDVGLQVSYAVGASLSPLPSTECVLALVVPSVVCACSFVGLVGDVLCVAGLGLLDPSALVLCVLWSSLAMGYSFCMMGSRLWTYTLTAIHCISKGTDPRNGRT